MITAALFLWLAFQGVSPEAAQHMQAGVEAHKQGQFDVAIKEFRKATASDPNLAEGFLDLGEVCLETRDYPAAVAALKRALELSPELDAAHLQLGYALLAQGYAEEAIPHLTRCTRWKRWELRKLRPDATRRRWRTSALPWPIIPAIKTYCTTSATPAGCFPSEASTPS